MATERVEYVLSLQDLLSGKIKDADGNVKKFEGSMNSLQSTALKVGAAIGAAFAVTKLLEFGRGVVEVGSQVENATTGLTTLLGNSASAAQVVKNTMEDATKTPFSFESLLSANKALIGANVEAGQARKTVIDLANAIAATGGGDVELQRMVVNLQQIKNVGKATAMDIKQFAIAGVNIYQVLADATGQPIEKIKDMEISYDDLTKALAKAHAEGGLYYNGLENMSNNTSVQTSNLGDAVFQLKNQMFTDLKPVITIVVGAMSDMIGMMKEGWEWFMRNKEMIGLVAVTIGGAAIGYGVYTLAVNASTIATTLWTVAQGALNAVLTANPIGVVVVGIGALIAAVVYAWNKFVGFRAVVMGVWGVLKEFGSLVEDYYTGLLRIMKGMFTFDASEIKAGLNQAVGVFAEGGKRIAEAYKKGYDEEMAAGAAKENEAGAAKENEVTAPAAAGGAAKPKPKTTPGATGTENKSISPKPASGTKSITVNVTIGKMIEKFTVQATTVQESSTKVRELVAQTLLSAVNDSQIVAGM